MKNTFKKGLSLLLALVMLISLLPVSVFAEETGEEIQEETILTDVPHGDSSDENGSSSLEGNEEVPELQENTGFMLTSSGDSETGSSITIITQPESCEVNVGETASLLVEATYAGEGDLSYLWQSYNCYTGFWEDANDFNTSYTDDVFVIENVTLFLNDYTFRCVISAPGTEITSNEAYITVSSLPNTDDDSDIVASGVDGNISWVLDNSGLLTVSGEGAMNDYEFSFVPWSSYKDFITSINIVGNITSIGANSFANCSLLENVSLPNTIQRIGFSAFASCTRLENISIPSGVVSLADSAFGCCSKLANVSLPESLTSIGSGAFCVCALSSISIPSSVTTIGDHAFADCPSLTDVYFNRTVPSFSNLVFYNDSVNIHLNVYNEEELAAASSASVDFIDIADNITVVSSSISVSPNVTLTVPSGKSFSIDDGASINVYGTVIVEAGGELYEYGFLQVAKPGLLKIFGKLINGSGFFHMCGGRIVFIDSAQYITSSIARDNYTAYGRIDVYVEEYADSQGVISLSDLYNAAFPDGGENIIGKSNIFYTYMIQDYLFENPSTAFYNAIGFYNSFDGIVTPSSSANFCYITICTPITASNSCSIPEGVSLLVLSDLTIPEDKQIEVDGLRIENNGKVYLGGTLVVRKFAYARTEDGENRAIDEVVNKGINGSLILPVNLNYYEVQSFAELIDAINRAKKTDEHVEIRVFTPDSSSINISSNLGIPSNVSIQFLQNVNVIVNPSITLTNNGNIYFSNGVTVKGTLTNNCIISANGDILINGTFSNNNGGHLNYSGNLTVNGTLNNTVSSNGYAGTIYGYNGATISINKNGKVTNNGQILVDGAITKDGTVSGNPICIQRTVINDEQFNQAIQDKVDRITICGDITVTGDVQFNAPSYIESIFIQEGSLTVDAGATLTFNGYSGFYSDPSSSFIIENGGRLVNNSKGGLTFYGTLDISGIIENYGFIFNANRFNICSGGSVTSYGEIDSVQDMANCPVLNVLSGGELIIQDGWLALVNSILNIKSDGRMLQIKNAFVQDSIVSIEDGGYLFVSDTAYKCLFYDGNFCGNSEINGETHLEEHEIAFYVNGGEEIENVIYTIDDEVELPMPIKEGYTFAGWYKEKALKNKVSKVGPGSTKDVILYAKWTPNTYTVIYDKNAEAATGTMTPQTMTYDKAATLKANGFKNPGYVFAGWATEPGATEAEFSNSQSVTLQKTGDEFSESITLYAIWKAAKATSVVMLDSEYDVVSGTTIQADMYLEPTSQLYAYAEPSGSSQLFKWTSSSTTIATIDQNGLVTFVKPGTVTITAAATDGSGKTAKTTFKVRYYDAATTLTAKTDVPAIGLQVDDTAQMSVFGADKSTALDTSMFTYTLNTVKNGPFISVDENGTITALKAGGTTTVTAALKDDPLNRKVSVSVKTIPVQTGTVHVLPNGNEELFSGVDANGNLCSESGLEAVSYALYLDKIPKGSPVQTYKIKVSAENSDGTGMHIIPGQFTWASTNTGIATVAEDKTDGSAVITVKANVDGACTITATSKDLAKIQGTIAVYVMDRSPRLDATSATLDSQKVNEATVGLINSYGYNVASVKFQEYNAAARQYDDEASDRIAVWYENEAVFLAANSYLKNQTIKGQLLITMADGAEHIKPFNVVIKNTAPSVTVKQPAKFNVFYTDSEALLNISVKNENINAVDLESDYFTGAYNGEDGALTVRFSNPDAKPVTSAKLFISLDGYAFPVEKAITIGTVTTKPKLVVTPASKVMNPVLGCNESVFNIEDKTRGEEINAYDLSTSASWIEQFYTNAAGSIMMVLKPNATGNYTGGKATITVKCGDWTSPVTVYQTITVKTAKPVAKLSSTALTLNSLFIEDTAETTITLDQANLIPHIDAAPELTAVPAGIDKDTASTWFSFASPSYGKLVAQLSSTGKEAIADGTFKNGTYTFSVLPCIDIEDDDDVSLNKLTFKITVNSNQPAVKLSKGTLTLNRIFTADTAETGISVNKDNVYLSDVELAAVTAAPSGVNKADALNWFDIGYVFNDEIITASINSSYSDVIKNGTYSLSIIPTVTDTFGHSIALKAVTLKITVNSTIPTVKLDKGTITLNSKFYEAPATSTVQLVNGNDLEITAIDISTTNAEAQKIIAYADSETGTITTLLDESNLPKAGTYTFNVAVSVSGRGAYDDVPLKTVPLKVTVNATLPKVTIKSNAVILNLNAATAGYEYAISQVTLSDSRFELSSDMDTYPVRITATGTAATLPEAQKIVAGYDFDNHNTIIFLDESNLPKAGTYTFLYTPYVVDKLSGQTVQLADVKFTVKVYNGNPSATVSASGKMDTVMRETSGITYTLTKLNNVSGFTSGNVYLTGDNADMFEIKDVTYNAKGQMQVRVGLIDGLEYSTAKTYKIRLMYELYGMNGEYVYVETGVLSVKPTQSALKLTATPTTQNFYQSQSRSRVVTYTVKLTSPEGAEIDTVNVGNVSIWQKALVKEADNIKIEIDGDIATIQVTLKDTSKLKAGSSYTLPLEFKAVGCATNVAATKLNLSLKVLK